MPKDEREEDWNMNLKDIPIDGIEKARMCCANCQKYFLPQLADYTKDGCTTTWEEGFVCMAFCHENPPLAMRMIGLDPAESRCEEFVPRKERR